MIFRNDPCLENTSGNPHEISFMMQIRFNKFGLSSMIIGLILLVHFPATTQAATGKWASSVTGGSIIFRTSEPVSPLKDYTGNYMTVVYLENLNVKKIGRNSNAKDVKWLLAQGYRVIELNYAKHPNAGANKINTDIIAINDSIAKGAFCGYSDCSKYRSYVLFEGYRISRDVPYFKDNPAVYNYSPNYTDGDSLRMDIIYPANTKIRVPVILSFSYSNSYHGDANTNQRLNLSYTLAGFNDSFQEGAPAYGIAWAIADHPKYCPWGSGKPANSTNNKAYSSFETNPDAAQKVKSAIRTLRALGLGMGLSGKIGIYGFSRGSTAGSLSIGDKVVPQFENAGLNIGISDDVQAAALGSGVFDFTQIYNASGDGDAGLENNCPLVWGTLSDNYELWKSQGAAYLVKSAATAPVLFFYNTDDALYYHDQIKHFKAKLDSLGVPTSTLINYGKGHSVPQTDTSLLTLYRFFNQHLTPPVMKK